MSTAPDNFDPVAHVDKYRDAIAKRDAAEDEISRHEYARILERLREEWVSHNGGDESELHEVAFGG